MPSQVVNVDFNSSKVGNTIFVPGALAPVIFTYDDRSGGETGTPRRIEVGAGIRSNNMAQAHNVSRIDSLGHYDIVEHVPQNVASNTLSIAKQLNIARQLAHLGLVGFGSDVLGAPNLSAYVASSVWTDARTGGKGVTFVRAVGLTMTEVRLDVAAGQTVIENVSYFVDRFEAVKNDYAQTLFEIFQKRYPTKFAYAEQIQPFSFRN
jgi:hypothetical protein